MFHFCCVIAANIILHLATNYASSCSLILIQTAKEKKCSRNEWKRESKTEQECSYYTFTLPNPCFQILSLQAIYLHATFLLIVCRLT